MGISYYLFVFFIFILVCIILFICKFLFSNIKNQNKLLDEKESKLLRLYQTMEDAMDEFSDYVSDTKSEIEATVKNASSELRQHTADTIPEEKRQGAKRATISYLIDEDTHPEETQSFSQVLHQKIQEEPPSMPVRNEQILQLDSQGKTRTEIAKDLGITLAEVDLVIGINKKNDL